MHEPENPEIRIAGQGKCGVAVIRVSGSNAANAILKMTDLSGLPKPRTAALKYVHDPVTRDKLDRGIVLWFPGRSNNITLVPQSQGDFDIYQYFRTQKFHGRGLL